MIVPESAFNRHKSTIDKAGEAFNRDTITWVKHNNHLGLFREELSEGGQPIDLNVLISYNTFRTWPITKNDQAGQLDNQNILAIINRQYLKNLNLLTPEGMLDYSPDVDYFIHRGVRYKAEGDTLLAQSGDDPLLLQVILHREENKTGEQLYKVSSDRSVILTFEPIRLAIKTLKPL